MQMNKYLLSNNNDNITQSSEPSSDEESENADSLEDVIEINVFYNGKNLKIAYNKENQFSEFYELLREILENKITLENYDIIYKLNKISPDEDRPISDILLDDDNEPSFILKKKQKFIKPPSYRDTTVLISFFPSFMDLAEQMNNFFDSQKEDTDFTVNYKDNCCSIIFREPEKAFTFITFLTQLKFTNQIYKKMKIDIKYKIKDYNNIKNSSKNNNKSKGNKVFKIINPIKKVSKLSQTNLNFVGLKKYLPNVQNFSQKIFSENTSKLNEKYVPNFTSVAKSQNFSNYSFYNNNVNNFNNKNKKNFLNETSINTHKKKRFYLLNSGQIVN
jgi:hypothetical protein